MSAFKGAAYYYARYRPGVPQDVACLLVDAANRDLAADTLLDVGTGTGQVIEALHPHFADIIGIDPDGEMLSLAEHSLRDLVSPTTRLQFWRGRVEEFTPPTNWTASFVTFCRTFHWVDQPSVLMRLADYVAPEGTIAVFGDSSFWDANSDWKKAVRRVIQEFLGEQRRAGEGVFSHHNRPYTDILRESPFSDVEEVIVPVKRTWTSESILGYLYSTSFATPSLFGYRLPEFEAHVRTVLATHADDDRFPEDNAFVVRLGRRPKAVRRPR
jgi:trans-aconitate methyltransferase